MVMWYRPYTRCKNVHNLKRCIIHSKTFVKSDFVARSIYVQAVFLSFLTGFNISNAMLTKLSSASFNALEKCKEHSFVGQN